MQEILVMRSARTDCKGGGGEAEQPLGTIFLSGKSRGSIAFGNPRFSGGKSY